MNDTIKEYFGRFGEVNSMEILENDNIQLGLIEFKMAETAARVLAIGNHCIESCNVEVKAAEPWHQPDHILNALNDYCLRAVLSNLSLADITNAANACVRFNQQAKAVFSTKHQRMDLTEFSATDAKNSIKTFGSLAHSIDITRFPNGYNYWGISCAYAPAPSPGLSPVYEPVPEPEHEPVPEPEHNSEILSTIDSCCSSILSELKLSYFMDTSNDIFYRQETHDSAFKTLKKIAFHDCRVTYIITYLLSLCSELKVLELNTCFWSSENEIVSKYEKLEELRLVRATDFNDSTLEKFIRLNPTLVKLSFIGRVGRHLKVSKTLYSIAENLPNLLELEFQDCPYDSNYAQSLRHLAKLSSLKVLKIGLCLTTAKQLCDILTTNDIPIECLGLYAGKIDKDAIRSISQMKKLKILDN